MGFVWPRGCSLWGLLLLQIQTFRFTISLLMEMKIRRLKVKSCIKGEKRNEVYRLRKEGQNPVNTKRRKEEERRVRGNHINIRLLNHIISERRE